jgi:O-acetyl-ADP-ribose deacetylase (regulator of RNase III)
MMIEPAQGNILEADAEALVNTVNCVGVMGKGIALQFKQAFPANFTAYEKACRAGEVQPGRMFVTSTDRLVNPRYIINFPTKRHWRGASRIEDIEQGLAALVHEIRSRGIRSVAIPPLGCGNGGLEWGRVRPLIEQALANITTVHVLLYEPAGAPPVNEMHVATKPPMLTRSRALVVRLLDLYRVPGYRSGRLEVQKLCYLLQEAGEPLKLAYEKHLYGPYAESLNHALLRMEGHLIRGYGDRNGRSAITVLPGAAQAAAEHLRATPEAQTHLDRVAALIEGYETPYGMELLATVHWVATREDPAAAEDVERAVAGVQGWNQRKRDRFQPVHIRTAWRRLREMGWLVPSAE